MPILTDPRLLPREVESAVAIGELIREGSVAAFVGAGLSIAAGLPSWTALSERLIRAWQGWDSGAGVRKLSPDNYVNLIRGAFGSNDLAFVSYLRRRLADERSRSAPAFSNILYQALYSDSETGSYIYPEANDVHRHLVALFSEHPRHLWTTNYDDLLERAAADLEPVMNSSRQIRSSSVAGRKPTRLQVRFRKVHNTL